MTPGTVSSHRSSPSAMTGFWTLPSTLTTLDGEGDIRHWDLSPTGWLQRVCTVANRNLTLTEWQRFIGDPNDPQRPYHKTCPNLPGPTDAGPSTPVADRAGTPISATLLPSNPAV